MKKIFKYMMIMTIGVLAAACTYDESELGGQLDDIKNRIEKMKGDIVSLNDQLAQLNEIAEGNPITSVERDSDGKVVITYLDNNNEPKTVVLAEMDYMVSVPVLGVKQENETSPYYWTVGEDWLMKDGKKVPVSGFAPNVSVDAEGYWTVDGERIKDFNGNDLYAHDDQSCLFDSIDTDEDGNLVITQGNGNIITIPVQSALNLTLSAGVNTPVLNVANPISITYEVSGIKSADAMVAIADVSGLSATIDRQTKTITVSFASSFKSGYLVVVAYDLEEHTVIRPVFFSTGSGDDEGGSDEPLDYYPIRNAQDLVSFASAVNAGTGMESMDAKLMNDIDMAGVSSWTPIGHCVFSWASNIASITSGTPYKANFDGQNFTIRNFNLTCANATAGKSFGMFGTLADGAVVENINFDSSCSITVSPTAQTDCGLVAGCVLESTVRNINSSAPQTYDGSASAPDNLRMTLGMVGFAYAGNNNVTIQNLVNKGAVVVKNSGHNTKNGATGIQTGGILGFATNGNDGADMAGYVNVVNCTNDGNMTSDAARTAGIVGASNRFTFIDGCTNNGSQINSHAVSKGGRLGNITCITGSGSKLRNCTNNGDLVSTTSARIGGVVGFVNHNANTFEGCRNNGNIISDWDAGLFFGYDNVAATFTNCVVSGSTGTYNGGSYKMNSVTSSNYITNKYVGNIGTNATSYVTATTIRFVDANAPGIKSAADLVEFASLVNSGQSYAKYQDDAGGVNILNDIDMSSVTSWTPIGYAVCPAGASDAAITGNAFTGRFSGNNYKIKNLKLVASGSEADKNYGLFGTLAPGATVENIIFDSSCSLEVTATAKMACGVVAGYVYDATVRDVQSYASMTFKGKAGDAVFMSMGVVGQTYCNTLGVIVDSVHNYGDIVTTNSDNDDAGATAYHAAGIVGFAHALQSSEKKNTISSCSNYGNMTSQFARTSGIVAAANRNTEIFNCENNGDQVNSFPTSGGARLGNITCNISNTSSMTGCTNYGNLTSTTSGRCGGITSLPNKVVFTNCANYGEILTDDANRGLFFGFNGNGNASTWKSCTAGGKVGTYNNGSPVYDSYSDAEKESYLGKFGNTAQNYESITYLIGTTEPSEGGDAEYNILFIGNSFTKDAVEHLPGLLAGAGNKKVNMTHIYYGGQFISTYNSKFDDATGFTCYTCKPGAAGWSNKTGVSIKDCCNSAEWDVVTIQEHTGNKCAWEFTSTSESDLRSLISKINATQETAPKYYYIMSQAYHNMNKIGSGSQSAITWTDQIGMYNVIVAFARKMIGTGCFEDVIATGTMLQNLRTSSLQNSLGLTRDGYHMDNGISRYGAACVVFEKLITPMFGSTMDTNTFRYNVSSTTENQYTTPVTDDNAPIAIQAARYAIQKPYEITDMGGGSQPEPENPEVGTSDGGIDDASEFHAFLQAVSAGTSLVDYMNTDGEVILKDNIDLSSITNAQWQAIADGTNVANNTYVNTITAGAFTGLFNGNGKKITGFNPTVELAANKTFGLLPVLSGATVKNLEISGAMNLSATAMADAGMLCGTATNSTIQNVKVSGTIESTGTSVSGKRFSIGGISGYANAAASKKCTISSCTSDIDVTAVGNANAGNGGTGAMYGGIVGYATSPNEGTAGYVEVTGCTNNGDMNVTLGRCSGIVASAVWNVSLSDCTNNGNQVNAIADGRLGNVACVVGSGGNITNCVNNGNIETTDTGYKGTIGGIFALIGTNNIVVSGGANYGTVKTQSTASNKGLVGAYLNVFKSVTNVTVSGKLYVDGVQATITDSNYMDYVGKINSNHASKVTNLIWVAPAN